MTNDANEILGLMVEDDETAPAVPTGLNLNLSLSDDDLEGAPEFKDIPAGTVTTFEIYTVSPSVTNGTLKWKVTFRAVEDTWGPGKQVSDFFTFKQTVAWKWGPFLKAAGLIQGGGDIDSKIFDDPSVIEGRKVQAKVLGYSWKGEGFPRSYGKNPKPVPTDGTRYYEDLGNYKPAPEESDESSADGSAEFSEVDYL